MIWAYPAGIGRGAAALWDAGRGGVDRRDVADVARLDPVRRLASSAIRRLPGRGSRSTRIDEPRGVFAITRHPMMWGFALWALVHAIVNPTPPAW